VKILIGLVFFPAEVIDRGEGKPGGVVAAVVDRGRPG